MPYIIKVGERRSACATYSEARDEAAYEIEVITGGDPDYEEMYTNAQNFSELGETFGPLPDGSMVEVRHLTWHALAASIENPGADVPHPDAFGELSDDQRRTIIDAYNEKVTP